MSPSEEMPIFFVTDLKKLIFDVRLLPIDVTHRCQQPAFRGAVVQNCVLKGQAILCGLWHIPLNDDSLLL